MMRQALLIGLVLVWATIFTLIAVDRWHYLQEGYRLVISIAGDAPSTVGMEFPIWRKVMHLLLWLGALATLGLFFAGHKSAVRASVGLAVSALAIGLHDFGQYGTMGSPTSNSSILLLGLLVLAAWNRSRLVG